MQNLKSGWICSAHPDIMWNAEGTCPICNKILEAGEWVDDHPLQYETNRRLFIKLTLSTICSLFALAYDRRLAHSAGMNTIPVDMGGGRCGMHNQTIGQIPAKLPTPTNSQWLSKLRDILSLERLSLVQYQTDEDKFNVRMPYMRVIPQEEDHIAWISALFTAYGLSASGPTPAIKRSQTIRQAYEVAQTLESNLIPQYEWLISNAEDNETQRVLNPVLAQTRMHYMMFSHALRMGGMMGRGRM
jgi:hypothetical protein